MKFIFVLLISTLSSSIVFANSTCEVIASKAVNKLERANNKSWRVELAECSEAANGKVNLCEVSGSNGDGAGDKNFLVVLSENCSKVLEVRLIGEE